MLPNAPIPSCGRILTPRGNGFAIEYDAHPTHHHIASGEFEKVDASSYVNVQIKTSPLVQPIIKRFHTDSDTALIYQGIFRGERGTYPTPTVAGVIYAYPDSTLIPGLDFVHHAVYRPQHHLRRFLSSVAQRLEWPNQQKMLEALLMQILLDRDWGSTEKNIIRQTRTQIVFSFPGRLSPRPVNSLLRELLMVDPEDEKPLIFQRLRATGVDVSPPQESYGQIEIRLGLPQKMVAVSEVMHTRKAAPSEAIVEAPEPKEVLRPTPGLAEQHTITSEVGPIVSSVVGNRVQNPMVIPTVSSVVPEKIPRPSDNSVNVQVSSIEPTVVPQVEPSLQPSGVVSVYSGADLRSWRHQLRLTQAEAAERLGVTQATISKNEGKDVLPEMLSEALANALKSG